MRRGLALLAVSLVVVVASLGLVDPPASAVASVSADAALVMSGDVDEKRLLRAVELHRAGSVRAVLVTGAGIGGDSASYLREVARRAGVPETDIVAETASTTTRENLERAIPLIRARAWRRVALVTSSPHMARALGVARKAGPDIEWIPVAVPEPGGPRRVYHQRLMEWGKLTWYAARGWI